MVSAIIVLVTLPLLTTASPYVCPAFEPFRCPEEERCIAIQVIHDPEEVIIF